MPPFITSILAFFSCLLTIVKNVPAAIAIVKTVMGIVNSKSVKTVLKALRDVIAELKPSDIPDFDSVPPEKRPGLLQRFKWRFAQKLLGFSDSQMSVAMNAFADPENTAEFTA